MFLIPNSCLWSKNKVGCKIRAYLCSRKQLLAVLIAQKQVSGQCVCCEECIVLFLWESRPRYQARCRSMSGITSFLRFIQLLWRGMPNNYKEKAPMVPFGIVPNLILVTFLLIQGPHVCQVLISVTATILFTENIPKRNVFHVFLEKKQDRMRKDWG